MWDGTGPVDGRSEMFPKVVTGRYVSTRMLATLVNVSDKAHNNLDESTHPIGRTILIQMMMPSLSGANGTAYVKAPTWDGRRAPQWYASVPSSF